MTASAVPDTVPSIRTQARFRRMRGTTMVGVGPAALELSDTAVVILGHVDGRRSVARIGELVAQEFGIDADEATADVLDLVRDLAGSGVLALEAPEGP
ncbi:hypothetical protein OK074_5881 [Actinobacteria bacterium OK074]|nr:hypothetical protein OK074_5881 [Actinobacteria bacterium OK074]